MTDASPASSAWLKAFLARNPKLKLSLAALSAPKLIGSLDWGADAGGAPASRDALLELLRRIARLAHVERDPLRAHALVCAGYLSAHHIARETVGAFVQAMEGTIGAEAAWAVYQRAQGVRSLAVQRWMRVREAVSPYHRMLSARTRPNVSQDNPPPPVAPGLSVNYPSLFGEAPYADVPHDASILGPGAYFTDLMSLVQRSITDLQGDLGPLALSQRRPDLWNLLLTPENATDLVSNADLVLEILESTVAAQPPDRASLLTPSYPPGAPDVIEVTPSWPSPQQAGTTYVVDRGSGTGPVVVGADPLTKSTTIRSGLGMQAVSIQEAAIVIEAPPPTPSAPSVVIEGFSFSFGTGATATSLLSFVGGSLTLRNCVFSASGPTLQDGWAITCAGATGTIVLENCTFVDTSDAASHAAIDATSSGPLTLSLADSILWPKNRPAHGYAAVKVGTRTAVNVGFCDIRGGRASITSNDTPATAQTNYANTNFDASPEFKDVTFAQLQPSSPCIGRGSHGNDVGASLDVYDWLAWAIASFDLPFDLRLESGRLALEGLGTAPEEIDRSCSGFVKAWRQNLYFPLTQLGLSLADYQVLTHPLSGGLEPYFGLSTSTFLQEAVVLAPSLAKGPGWSFPASAFGSWTGLSPDGLRELVYQDLSPAEIAERIQEGGGAERLSGWCGFYVNGQEAGACNTLALLTQYAPVGQYALAFTASDGVSVSFPAFQTPPSGSFTVSFWMYLPAAQEAVLLSTEGQGGIEWRMDGASLRVQVPGASSTLDLSAFLAHPQWVHIATVYDQTAQTLTTFVNGERAAQASQVQAFSWPAASGLSLGGPCTTGTSSTATTCFSGGLCELTVWKVARTAEDLQAGFQRPAMLAPASAQNAPPPDLLAYWPVNDNAGKKVLDWADTSYPQSPNNGIAQGAATFAPVGLPHQHALSAGQSLNQQGLIFVRLELLTGTADGVAPGVTLGNLDRINRFVRLARRTGWSFTELDWALFTLFQLNPAGTHDFTTPAFFADLARLRLLQTRLELGLREVCALVGPLKPFGMGRLGDGRSLFDALYNRPPFAATTFSPDMSLVLLLKDDFETPGPIARRLAAMLTLDTRQLTAIARQLASGDTLTISGATLTAFYRYRVVAGWLGLDIESLIDLLHCASLSTLGSSCTPSDLSAFVREVRWIADAKLKPTDLRYLTTPPDSKDAFPYQQKLELEFRERLPRLTEQLERELSVWRVGPASFISPVLDEARSVLLFTKAVQDGYLDPSGLITSKLWARLPVAPYRVPSAEYKTIGEAVAAAAAALGQGAPAVTVLVAAGTHDQPGDSGIQVTLSGGVLTLQSEAGPGTTVIDCKKASFLQLSQGGNAQVVINGLTVQNASGSPDGGAITTTCPLQLVNCIFKGNTAHNGGAVCVLGPTGGALEFVAENCVFYSNIATSTGGALSLTGSKALLRFCTLYQNSSALNLSNGVHLDADSLLTIDHSILWDTSGLSHDDWSGGGIVIPNDSDLNAPNLTKPDKNGCIFVDPKLLDPLNGVYEPGPGSPCIGAARDGANMGYGGSTGELITVLALYPFAYAQIAVLHKSLARFFRNEQLPLDAVLSALGPSQNGLQLLTGEGDSTPAVAYLRDVFRYVLLADLFGLDGRLLALVFSNPSLLSLSGGGTPYQPTLRDLRTLARFADLRTRYPGAQEALIATLRSSVAGTLLKPAEEALAHLFDWSTSDVRSVLEACRSGCLTSVSTQENNGALKTAPRRQVDPQLHALTVEAWVRTSTPLPPSTAKAGNTFLGFLSATTHDWSFVVRIEPGSRNFTFNVEDPSTSTQNRTAVTASSITVEANRWYHVCAVFNAGSLSLFVDGNLCDSKSVQQDSIALSPSSQGMILGQDLQGIDAGVTNSIAEVRLWRTARTPEQIRARMQERILSSEPDFSNLSGYWTFEDTRWLDETGNWNAGQPNGEVKQFFEALAPVALAQVLSSAEAIDLSQRTGLDVSLLLALYRNGLSVDAEPLLAALAAKDSDTAGAVQAAITDRKREALKRFALRHIDARTRPLGFPVVNDNRLSDYLLVDVDMAAQTSTSRIVQATLSLQQYVQRCQLGLEPGVGAIGITDTEWGWMGTYREWEANRKVFLHPETYVRPELRKNKTPLFVELERSLANSELTRAGLEKLYRRYLDQLAVVSSLHTVGSWYEPAERIDSALVSRSKAGGNNAFVQVSPNWSEQLPTLSVEAWVRSSAKQRPPDGNKFLGFGASNNYVRSFVALGFGPSGLLPAVYLKDDLPGNTCIPANVTMEAGRWYHLCFVFDHGAVTLYVDGRVCSAPTTVDYSTLILPQDGAMFLGQDPSGNHGDTVNSIAEVRFWNTARTREQILANMRRRIPVSAPDFNGLLGYWTFDDDSLVSRAGQWTQGTVSGDVSFEFPTLDLLSQTPAAVDTYHFIGRTRTQPFTFYHRVKEVHGPAAPGADSVWGPWEQIGLSINSPYASPVVVDGQLYLFWAETRYVNGNDKATPPVVAHNEVTLKYSRRNADGSWLAPQSPFPTISLPGNIDLDASPVWRKPYALPMASNGKTAILVIYGGSSTSTTPFCYVLNRDQTVTTGLSVDLGSTADTSYSLVEPVTSSQTPALYTFTGQSILAANYFDVDSSIVGIGTDSGMYGTTVSVFPADFLKTGGTFVKNHSGTLGNTSLPFLRYGGMCFTSIPDGSSGSISLYGCVDPRETDWNLINQNIAPQGNGVIASMVAWNGSIYGSINGKDRFSIIQANSSALTSTAPWTLSFQYSFVGVDYGLGPQLVPGDDGNLYCFFVNNGTVYGTSCDRQGNWKDPAATSIGSAAKVSAPVFWNWRWYCGVSSPDGSVHLWQATTLGGPWTHLQQATVPSGASILVAGCPTGFVCIQVDFPSGMMTCIKGTPDPRSQGWTTLPKFVPYANPTPTVLILARLPGAPASQLLASIPADASSMPVANQLSAYTFAAAGAEFLIRAWDASTSTLQRLDAQVVASVADGLVTLSGTSPVDLSNAHFSFERLTSTTVPALSRALAEGGVDALLGAGSQRTPESPFFDLNANLFDPNVKRGCVLPPEDDRIRFELSNAYGLYFRELFFFIPWLIAEQLQKNRHFKEARQYLEYIFKPSAAAGGGDYWRCAWLAGVSPKSTLEALEQLDPAALALYRKDPFDSGAIADLRPSAYQRAIVTAYIQNLLAWGDDLFAQNTRESIHQAEQLYRYAGDLLGPRPRRVEYTPPPPETYAELRAQEENEFLLALERLGLKDGASAPTPPLEGMDPNGSIADYGFYFGVPDSPEFLANWDRVEDRLYKIRNGLDLAGAQNDLSLFEPPLSLEEIQRRGSQGGAGAAAGNSSNADRSLEGARFSNLLFSARMMANSVIEFGSSLLRALEAKDADGLAALQVGQQSAIAERLRLVRTEEVNNVTAMLASQQAALESAQHRKDFYAQLIRNGWSAAETAGVTLASGSLAPRMLSLLENQLSVPLHLLPEIFGFAVGGASPGAAVQAQAAVSGDMSALLSESASLANTIASYERRAQEWQLQQRLAEFDITQLNAQIQSAQHQVNAARLQSALEETTLKQARDVEAYYRNKFTNAELYGWMADTLGQLYSEIYQVALGMAQLAQAALTSLSGLDQQFISNGGWDSQRKGLLAGESLLLDLARMEQAYWQWERAQPPVPLAKIVSLKKIDPYAYLQLVTTGACTFKLSEELFDRDHPGHYLRTLQSLSLQLPGVADERGEVHASLTRLSHELVRQPDAAAVGFLLGTSSEIPGRALRRSLQSRHSALSHAALVDSREQGEFHSGNLDIFAGGGAVSTWRLELPPEQSRLDLLAVDDVVLTVHYTARHGGEAFRREVEAALPAHSGTLLLDIARDFPEAWRAFQSGTGDADRKLTLKVTRRLLPRNLPGRTFRLHGLHLGSFHEADVFDATPTVVLQGPQAGQGLPLIPVAETGNRVSSAVLSTPVADFLARPWTLTGVFMTAAATPPVPDGGAAQGLWLLADYSEE
ncbi:hypothetical protein HMI49_24910 [Corallococcus exercitus]|uniref:LamG-like jellyroll fold domain-containing protein n=1 Tax=Corallococcus exercitus TaxID=2316736 RepID=A0A7Y4KM98_9BACT|nr:LamG-like jellyroll fold domain-containing protein [Corallococcus exercitus]NOK36453.1 hypothetical protein [Corallococcus exercitus]